MPEFKLISTETLGPTSLKHMFVIIDPSNEECASTTFNIYSFAEILFLYRRYDDGDIHLKIKIKKHKVAENVQVILKVICNNYAKKYSKEILCTENWCQYDMGYCPNPRLWEIEFHTTVNKIDSITTKIYEDQDFTDFHLSTVEGNVAVHRAVLAANSDVFKTMLSQEWKETAEGHLQIEGVTLQTLQHLKQYMYLGTLPDDGLLPLLQLAMYYLMTNLKSECLMRLPHSVTAQNLHDILEYSISNKIHELTFAVLETMPASMVYEARQLMFKKETDEQVDQKNEGVNEE